MNWLWFMSVLALFTPPVCLATTCYAVMWCEVMWCALYGADLWLWGHSEQLLHALVSSILPLLLLPLLLLCLMSASLYDQKFKVPLFDCNPVEGERNKFFDSSTDKILPPDLSRTWYICIYISHSRSSSSMLTHTWSSRMWMAQKFIL